MKSAILVQAEKIIFELLKDKNPLTCIFTKEVDLNMIVHIKSVYSSIQFGDFPP